VCSAAAAAAAAAAAGPTLEQLQQQHAAFNTCVVSLTHLDLELAGAGHFSIASKQLSAALARFSSLQELRLACMSLSNSMPSGCLAGVGQLHHLTSLTLQGLWVADPPSLSVETALQQLLAQPLQLQQLCVRLLDDCTVQVDMAALTQLTQLQFEIELQQGSVLPVQRQQLELPAYNASDLDAVISLQQLTQLQLAVVFEEPQALLSMAQLPALQHLSLHYYSARETAPTAPAWPLMPQLRELRIEHVSPSTKQQMAQVRAALAKCTALTKLDLGDWGEYGCKEGVDQELVGEGAVQLQDDGQDSSDDDEGSGSADGESSDSSGEGAGSAGGAFGEVESSEGDDSIDLNDSDGEMGNCTDSSGIDWSE
jgi:hypothetical protein